MGTAKPN